MILIIGLMLETHSIKRKKNLKTFFVKFMDFISSNQTLTKLMANAIIFFQHKSCAIYHCFPK